MIDGRNIVVEISQKCLNFCVIQERVEFLTSIKKYLKFFPSFVERDWGMNWNRMNQTSKWTLNGFFVFVKPKIDSDFFKLWSYHVKAPLDVSTFSPQIKNPKHQMMKHRKFHFTTISQMSFPLRMICEKHRISK